MNSVFTTQDIILNIAAYLAPKDAHSFLMSSKMLHAPIKEGDEGPIRFLPSLFMEESLKSSLMSIMSQRDEFQGVDVSMLRKLGAISQVHGRDQIAIAGSLIVQAITTSGDKGGDKFTAGDVDMYCTVPVLPHARQLLVEDLGLVLTKVSTSSYNCFRTAIHHVESYSLPSVPGCVTTAKNAIKRMKPSMRQRLKFLLDEASPYAVLPTHPFAPRNTSPKAFDLVVTTADTVKETIYSFDFTLCMSWCNGNRFFVPELFQILQHKARLRCPLWAAWINEYVAKFLSMTTLSAFARINQLQYQLNVPVVNVVHQCYVHMFQQGYSLPDIGQRNEEEVSSFIYWFVNFVFIHHLSH